MAPISTTCGAAAAAARLCLRSTVAVYLHHDASHHHHSRKDVLEVQSQPSHFNGVLELGGASFQVRDSVLAVCWKSKAAGCFCPCLKPQPVEVMCWSRDEHLSRSGTVS
eukprot:1161801-Pelagomonas_calceolata.AAC.5